MKLSSFDLDLTTSAHRQSGEAGVAMVQVGGQVSRPWRALSGAPVQGRFGHDGTIQGRSRGAELVANLAFRSGWRGRGFFRPQD
ncbi:hypothetical protein [Geitlerinema sp. PCC 7407]|uniref:hypothetical protein n=1 Tax=Geitlerinema sp. PCC 7407 TaxID=1173025 RepID=UPI001237189C|nr:hypothetical protein [Geitlerinema sp. PCC 7407]